MEQESVLTPWPSAKVLPPDKGFSARLRTLVSRPRLVRQLDAAARAGHVTLVLAPGGSGKTSLLADWARQAPLPVAWYALDSADRDTRRLMSGLCAAIEHVYPGAAAQASSALKHGAIEAAAVGLLLGALENRPLALVLDDFHQLDDRPEAVAFWDHFLRFRPPSLALIILSRTVPLLGFAALAAMDELVGLGQSDLRFDAGEAADLLAAHGLDPRDAARLAKRSGGWATGMLLLARATREGVGFLRARVDVLLEHLGGEVLNTLPAPLRRFLLESAALGPITAEGADAILNRRDSAIYFAETAARGLFLEQSDTLYRYHDLFAEYLVGVLEREDPERLQAIRRASADYWSAQGDLPRALGLLADGEDWEALAAMLERERVSLWTRGLWGTALTHIERLPPEYHTPRLLALCGHARAERGEHAEALALADAGMAASRTDEEWLSPALLRVSALVHASRYDEAVQSSHAALDVAERSGYVAAITRLRELRGIAHLRLGHFEQGYTDLLDTLAAHEEAENEAAASSTLFNLATQLLEAGHARDAEAYLDRVTPIARRLGNSALSGYIHNSRALLHLLMGDTHAAQEEVRQALAVAREVGHPLLECTATATLAEACVDAGNISEANRYAKEAAAMSARLAMDDAANDAHRALIALALMRRERAEARRLIDEGRELARNAIDNALLDLYEGMLALRSRAVRRAAEVLGEAAERLEAVHRPHSAARALLLQAEALLAIGAIRRAENSLNRLAALVGPSGCEGYLRPTARLCRQVFARYRFLRQVRRGTRQLLDSLVREAAPPLTLLPHFQDEAETLPDLWLSPFGMGRIVWAGRELEPHALSAKARELLFFAAHRGRPLRRDEIIEALWDGDMEAIQSFWNAGRDIRRVLGEHVWGPRNGTYAIRLRVHDAGREFEHNARAALSDAPLMERLGAAERALELLGPGSGGYLEWCDSLWTAAERTRVMHLATAVALAAATIYAELQRHHDAIAVIRRAAAIDPFDEGVRLALLRHLVDTGEAQTALAEYASFRRLLREELCTEPSPSLRAVAFELSGGKSIAEPAERLRV